MLDLVYALLITYNAPGAVPAKQLAKAIVEVANHYHEDPILVTQLIIVESRGKAHAYNSDTQDYGIMQLNMTTIVEMKLNKNRLFDWRYNLNAGVRRLHNLRKNIDFRPCAWNTGIKGMKKYPKTCDKYERKLTSIGGLL